MRVKRGCRECGNACILAFGRDLEASSGVGSGMLRRTLCLEQHRLRQLMTLVEVSQPRVQYGVLLAQCFSSARSSLTSACWSIVRTFDPDRHIPQPADLQLVLSRTLTPIRPGTTSQITSWVIPVLTQRGHHAKLMLGQAPLKIGRSQCLG